MQTVKEGRETGYTWAERQKELGEVREKFFKELKPVMPPQEGAMLLEIVRILNEGKSPWMNVQALVSQLKERLSKSEEEIEQTLKKLVDLKLVRTGASLPI
jgi:DNA-binding transcriptional ArsR family regulator